MNSKAYASTYATPSPRRIVLTIDINEQEAEDILALCQMVGGKPFNGESTRGVFDSIRQTLRECKIEEDNSRLEIANAVFFKDIK